MQAAVAIGAQPFMQESEQPNENMDAEQPSALQSMPIRAKAAIPLLGSAVQENPSFCGADLPLEDLLKIATPDYRSSEESSLSPDRLLYRLDDLLCSANTSSTEQWRHRAVIICFAQTVFGYGLIQMPNVQLVGMV